MRTLFSLTDLPATPWKNGGGSTREILCWPPGAGLDDFDWRVSIASIAASGPFSVFPGVDRTIMLLAGDGVTLRSLGAQHRLAQPLRPFHFSGDVPMDCTLLGGACSDLNVMARRTRGQAEVTVLHAEAVDIEPCRAGLLMSLAGDWALAGAARGARAEAAAKAADAAADVDAAAAAAAEAKAAADAHWPPGAPPRLGPGQGLWWADARCGWHAQPLTAGCALVAVRWLAGPRF